MIWRCISSSLLLLNAVLGGLHAGEAGSSEKLRFIRVPNGGIQPQAAMDEKGTIHLVYFSGDPMQGDLFYVTSTDDGATFSQPRRVNSQPGSAIAFTSHGMGPTLPSPKALSTRKPASGVHRCSMRAWTKPATRSNPSGI